MENFDLNKPELLTKESLVALFFATAGIYWFSCDSWGLGIISLVLAASLGFMYKGIGFDLPRQRYRIYTGLFQWRFGSWQRLPKVIGVTVKYFSELTTSGKPGRMRTDKIGYFVLMLSIYESSQGIILQEFQLNQEEYMMTLGKEIAQTFNVPLNSFL